MKLFNADLIRGCRDADPEPDEEARIVVEGMAEDATIRALVNLIGMGPRRLRALVRLIGAGDLVLLRYFVTPTTLITSEQTHGLYGVPVGDLLPDYAETTGGQSENRPEDSAAVPDKDAPPQTLSQRASPARRRKTTFWQPGTKE